MWHWDALGEEWRRVTAATSIHPGLTILFRADDGRYTEREGWRPESRATVTPLPAVPSPTDARYGGDPVGCQYPAIMQRARTRGAGSRAGHVVGPGVVTPGRRGAGSA